jgi:class 3 adenylate cyclase
VNLASRLQEFSDPMEITVQHEMAQILRDQFDMENLGEKTIRGFSEQDVWRLHDNKKDMVAMRA